MIITLLGAGKAAPSRLSPWMTDQPAPWHNIGRSVRDTWLFSATFLDVSDFQYPSEAVGQRHAEALMPETQCHRLIHAYSVRDID
ncbi:MULTISPECIES: hypothetical protein [Xanthomonas]|uniref:hypothetical protein n=1 Tax=Xanthomonas TaxID=338 RepID=UPI0012907820|nr:MULTISPECIES: hypothetical protein [Xanthomonas]